MQEHRNSKAGHEPIVFKDEPESHQVSPGKTWIVLVVDDDQQVHTVTLLALSRLTVHGRSLRFLHAYSAAEAFAVMQREPDVAVILLDVVMEKENAGLTFVRRIRDELLNHSVRVILRTGQPGYAPELQAIQDYDINDYKTKAELTRTRLITSITTAVRSYDQIRSVLRHQHGLEEIVRASFQLLSHHTIQPFSEEILHQLTGIAHVDMDGLVILYDSREDLPYEQAEIISASGGFAGCSRNTMQILDNYELKQNLCSMLSRNPPVDQHESGFHTVQLQEGRYILLIHFEPASPLSTTERNLLDVLLTNIKVGFTNICLIQQLERHAYYDELTGLMNGTRVTEEINRLIDSTTRGMQLIAIDVDSFSEINDALGYEFGNELLLAISGRLRTHFLGAFTLARLSGDTFCLLGPSESLKPQAVFSVLDEPFDLYDTTSTIPFTLGIIELDGFIGCGTDAVNKAILAMKQAKHSSRVRYLYFSRAMQEAIQTRVEISRSLKPALMADEFRLHYQPQVSIENHRIVGVEALVRWEHVVGQLISPAEFIPTAESTGIINDLGRWIMREAIARAHDWKTRLAAPLRIGINVSMKQFYSPSFLPFMSHVIGTAGVNPERIEIEITESLVMQDAERVISTLRKLKGLGVRIAIDDFGTGYSSLNHLLRMPLDRLKIDRSFIIDIETNERSRNLAKFLIQLGEQLNLDVIAEGIETEGQLHTMQELGCQEYQGFLFSPPLTSERLEQLL